MAETNDIIWTDKKRPFLGLPWSFTRYSLTDDRLIITRGFLSKIEDEIRLYRILDIQWHQTFWQRICGVGCVVIKSADKSMGNFEIRNIKNSKEVKNKLSDLIEENRDKKRVVNREYMSAMDGEDDDNDDDVHGDFDGDGFPD